MRRLEVDDGEMKHAKPKHNKPPLNIEIDGRIPESIADFIGGVLSSVGEIFAELKDAIVRYLRRH